MKEMVEFLAKHGYWILFAGVVGRQAFLPVPENLLLLAGGALAGLGRLSLVNIIAVSVLAFVVADLAWYEAGRRWGSKTLHFICGSTRDPTACVGKMTERFNSLRSKRSPDFQVHHRTGCRRRSHGRATARLEGTAFVGDQVHQSNTAGAKYWRAARSRSKQRQM
jgi:hypothetical protein